MNRTIKINCVSGKPQATDFIASKSAFSPSETETSHPKTKRDMKTTNNTFGVNCNAVRLSALAGIIALVCIIANQLNAGIAYQDPPGGWRYIFQGGVKSSPTNQALDGTWVYATDAYSSSWAGDGRGPGVGQVGGVSASNYVISGVSWDYITIEDASNTTSSGSNNRRFQFIHMTATNGLPADAAANLLTNVTITFRARLTPPTDPLLELPYLREAPNGYFNGSDGKGMFSIRQSNPGSIISFSLGRAAEDRTDTDVSAQTTYPGWGLMMNNKNGTTATANVDPGEGGTLVYHPCDPRVWNEFWIIITADTSQGGTHKVEVYMNGSTNPAVYYVTAGTGSDTYNGIPDYISLGLPLSPATGAYDIDFFGFKEGRWEPVANPDVLGPEIVDAGTYGSTNSIKITFSESVDPTTALNPVNYVVTNQYGVTYSVVDAYFFGDNRTVVIKTSNRLTPGPKYFVTANVKDLNNNANSSTWWFWQPSPAKAMVEIYGGMGNTGNPYASPDLRSIAKFASYMPDMLLYSNIFALQTNLADTGWNYYVGRLTAYFVPPSNGLYRFYTRSDDGSLFFMNTNSVNSTYPEGKVQLTQLTTYTTSYSYNSGAVSNIYLVAGQKYYMELLWRDGSGGDGATITVRSQGDVNLPSNESIIPPGFLELPVGPITLDNPPPATLNVPAGTTGITLTAGGISGALPWRIQWWYKPSGSGTFTAITGATNSSYTIPNAITSADNGTVYRLTISNLFSSVTYDTTLNVLSDNVPPTVKQVVGLSSDKLWVAFSEPMDTNYSSDALNYLIDGGTVYLSTPTLVNDSVVILTIDPANPLTPGTFHTLTVSVNNAIIDKAGNPLAETNIVFEVAATGTNGAIRELRYTSLNTGNSTLVNVLTNHPKFLNNTPDLVEYLTSFSTPANIADDYGMRVNGYLIPPVDGYYQFRINSDDEGRFYLSTDESPDNLRLITRYPDGLCCNWGFESVPVKLEANKVYYFEALLKEGSGNDSLVVNWRTPLNNNYTVIPGANLAYSVLPSKLLKIIQNPSNVTVNEYGDATFTALADSIEKGIAYKWQKSVDNGTTWTDITGATASTLTVLQVSAADNGSQYRCVATVQVHTGSALIGDYPVSVASQPATLTVISDTTPPRLLSATPQYDGSTIILTFSEYVSAATALNPANYQLAGTLATITNISFGANQKIVVLKTTPFAANQQISVSVQNIQDLAGNLIDDNYKTTQFTFTGPGFWADFNNLTIPPGANIYGNAWIFPVGSYNNGPYLQLIPATPNMAGSIVIEQLSPGIPVYQFTAKFKVHVGEGNVANPADGFSFNVATDLPNSAPSGVEAGVGTGLSVCFPFYNSDYIMVKYGGVEKARVYTTVYGKAPWVDVEIRLKQGGLLDVIYGGDVIFSNLVTGYVPNTNRFGIYARCGGNYANIWIDDLLITNLFNPGAVSFAKDLQSVTVIDGQPVVSRIEVNGTPPYTIKWYTNDILAAQNVFDYSFTPVLIDDGMYYYAVVQNAFSAATSVIASVTVLEDNTPPTIVSVDDLLSPYQLRIVFSEPVVATEANKPGNYVITPTIAVTSASLQPDGKTVILGIGATTPGTTYTIQINNITDRSEYANPLWPDTATFTAGWYGLANNVIKWSRFDSISGSTIDTLTNNTKYINNTPDLVQYSTGINGLAYGTNVADNYGMIMSGYLVVQTNGEYYFQWRTDDQGIFFLSTNEGPEGLQFMAQTTAANSTVTSTNRPYLVAGKWYFFVAMFKEGTGGDYGVVTWQPPGSGAYIAITNSMLFYAAHKDRVVGISVQPNDITVYENQTPVLYCQGQSVDMAGVTYQWQVGDGSGGFINVPGATSSILTYSYIPAGTSRQFRCIVSGTCKLPDGVTLSQTVTSRVATVTSIADTFPPQLLDVKVNNSLKCISLLYNERVNPITATNPANYVISGGFRNVQVIAAKIDSTGTNVLLWTTDQEENTEYVITVTQMADTAAVPNYAYNQAKIFRSWIYLPGYVMREFYYVTNNSVNLTDFFTSPKWPYYADDFSFTNAAHIGPTNISQALRDNYGARISGYFIPRVTGNHVFYLMHDDGGAFYMSTDDNPYNLRQLIFQNGSVQNVFADGANSVTNTLIAGQRYYFEAVMKELSGGDYVIVAVREPGDTTPAANLPIIGSSYLATYYPPATFSNIQISLQPTPPEANVAENTPVQITANAIMYPTNYSFMNYQWYRKVKDGDYVIVPGATANTIWGYANAQESPVSYKVVAYYGNLQVESDPAVITVSTLDTTAPTLVALKWLNGSQLQVTFSEPVSEATALNPANYTLTDGTQNYTITGARLLGDLKTVILNVTPYMLTDKAYTLTVSGVSDRAATPNVIATVSKTIVVYQGVVEYYAFTGIGGSDIASLTNNAKFINFTPDIARLIPLIDISSWGDNYGEYVRGYYYPPVTGNYIFYVASDDQSELWLSTDANPANKRLIAREESYGAQRDWTSNAGGRRTINPATGRYYNQSADIPLVANQRYYFEVKHKEGTGGDYLGVTVQKPGDPVPATGTYSTMVEISPTMLGQAVTLNTPSSVTLLENDPIIITSGVQGWPLPAIQWYKNGVALPGENGTNYYGPNATLADNGAQFYVVAGNPINTVTSQVITLNVIPDTFPPTVLGVDGGFVGTPNFLVRFSEKVAPATATNINNYQIDGGLSIVSATLLPDGSNVVLRLNPLPVEGATYNVTIANIIDIAAAANQLVQTTLTATAWYKTTNAVLVELYLGGAGSTLDYLTNSLKYQYNNPDAKIYLTSANFAPNLDYYGTRMIFYFIPPTTENYIFYVQHDDAVRVKMSTDERPENAVVVLNRDLAGGFGTFADGLDSFTNYVEAGKSYYVEVIHKEGTGGDYVRIAAKPASDMTPPASLSPLSGSVLAVYAPPPAQFNYAPLPATTNIYENVEAIFTVTNFVAPTNYITGIWYQWYKNGVDLPGSNQISFTTAPLDLYDDQGAVYGVKISVPGLPLITSETTVNVLQDTTPPYILSAASLDGLTIAVTFNEIVNTNESTDSWNYQVESQGQPCNLVGGALGPDLRSVILYVDPATPLSNSFTIYATGISDIAKIPNSIQWDTPSTFVGKVAHLTAQDIGTYGTSGFGGGVGAPTVNAALPGFTWYFTNDAMRVSGNGYDIWNNNDGFHYVYRQVTGNFDIKVRVESLMGADWWSKAGIMARISTNAGSRFIDVIVTPSNGQNNVSVQWRDTENGGCGSIHGGNGGPAIPPPYPNAWLRLQRIGSVFYGYWSSNAVDWNLYASRDTAAFGGAYPDTILVGLAVVSHNQPSLTNNAVAEFRDLMFPTINENTPFRIARIYIEDNKVIIECETFRDSEFVLEESVDLNSWTPTQTNTAVNGVLKFIDNNFNGNTKKFYRIRLQ